MGIRRQLEPNRDPSKSLAEAFLRNKDELDSERADKAIENNPVAGDPLPPPPEPTVESKRDEIQALLGRYNKAADEQARRTNESTVLEGLLRNPEKARLRHQNDQDYNNEPMKRFGDQFKVQHEGLAASNEMDLNDAKSTATKALKAEAEAVLGHPLPDGVTGAQIQTLMPLVKQSVNVYGTNVRADTEANKEKGRGERNDKNIEVKREAEDGRNKRFDKGEYGKNKRAKESNATRIAGAYLGQQRSQNTAGGANYDKKISEIPQSVPSSMQGVTGGKSYMIPIDGTMPSPGEEKEASDILGEGGKYISALMELRDLSKNGIDPFSEKGLREIQRIKSALMQAYKSQVKWNQDGVTNGKDLENAIETIGDPKSFINWLHKEFGEERLAQAIESAGDLSTQALQAKKFRPATKEEVDEWLKTHQKFGGGGGGSGFSNPVSPGSPSTVEGYLKQAGLAPPEEQKPTGYADIPPIKTQSIDALQPPAAPRQQPKQVAPQPQGPNEKMVGNIRMVRDENGVWKMAQ